MCENTHTHFSLPGEPQNTEQLIRIADKRTVGSSCLSEFIVIRSGTPSPFQTHQLIKQPSDFPLKNPFVLPHWQSSPSTATLHFHTFKATPGTVKEMAALMQFFSTRLCTIHPRLIMHVYGFTVYNYSCDENKSLTKSQNH